jgi:hypothetical protein
MAPRLIILAGWIAAAVLAVLVGLVAISVIKPDVVSSAGEPLSPADVERELRRVPEPATPAPSSSASGSPAPSPSAPGSPAPGPSASSGTAPRSFLTPGGTVVARCADGRAVIVSMAPAQGWSVHERDGTEGEFRGIRDDHDRVKVEVRCAGGTPGVEVRQESDDD